jgi:hypothetical protein
MTGTVRKAFCQGKIVGWGRFSKFLPLMTLFIEVFPYDPE